MNLFHISSILIFIASLGFGLIVFLNNPKAKLNRSWLLFSVLISLWGISLYMVTSSVTESRAIAWQYILDVIASFIPVIYLTYISSFLGLKGKFIQLISFFFALFIAILSTTTLFKAGVVSKFGFYWVNPGPYYFIFPLFFIACIAYAIGLLIYTHRKSNDDLFKAQIKFQAIAGIIGFSGSATNFLPQFFNIFPFGNYFILLYVGFISYSIIRYKLFNLKAVATELFSGGIVLLFFFNLLTSETLSDWLIHGFLLILVSFFGILIVRSVFREVEQREKIEKLAGDLEKANERLKFLDKQKSEFVSIASHQLRSPLTAIKGYASMITEGSFGKINEKAKEAVVRILESSQNLANVVEDLLNVTKIEQGGMKFEFAKVDLRKLAEDIIKDLKPNADRKGLMITFEDNGHKTYNVNADSGKIRQVVVNLLDNAIKYTPKGKINVLLEEDDAKGKIKLGITDSGIGVSGELKNRLFEKFSRGDGVSKVNTGGSGLGLYVAKEIVEAHHGKIWVVSDGEGKGSTFYVELSEYGRDKETERAEKFAGEL